MHVDKLLCDGRLGGTHVGLFEPDDGFDGLLHELVGIAEVNVELAGFREDLYGPVLQGNGFVETAQFHQRFELVIVGIVVGRIGLNGVVEIKGGTVSRAKELVCKA